MCVDDFHAPSTKDGHIGHIVYILLSTSYAISMFLKSSIQVLSINHFTHKTNLLCCKREPYGKI